MRYATCTALLIASCSAAATPSTQPEAPVLIAKGQDYVVHWLRQIDVVLYTEISTVTPTVLFVRSSWVDLSDRSVVHEGVLPTQVSPNEIVQESVSAVGADDQRLYILTAQRTSDGLGASDRLMVFWLGDGSQVYTGRVTELGAAETVRLAVIPGGVSCMGTEYRFDGRKLVKQFASTRPATEPSTP